MTAHPAKTPVTYRTITDVQEFRRLEHEWDRLVRAMPRPSPFFLHGWIRSWWGVYGGERPIWVEAAFDEGRLVGALPMEISSPLPGIRAAHFLGRHHAELGDVLAAGDDRVALAAGLLARARAARVDYFDLFGVPGESLLAAAANQGRLGFIRRIDAPTLDLRGGWDAVYRAKTGSKRRSLHQRRRRQLAALGEPKATVAREPAELEAALEEAFRLHALRWSGRPDGSEFTTPAGLQFHRRALRALAPLGIPRILLLHLDGTPIAFHYYFLLCDRMYVHRLAFDPAYGSCSPGLLATLASIEAAAHEGATRVEFLGGGERYKLELADRAEPLYEAIGLATSIRGRSAAWLKHQTVRVRLRLKRSEGLRRFYFEGLAPARRVLARRPPEAVGTGSDVPLSGTTKAGLLP